MSKHLRIPCPDCRRSLRISPEHVGRQVQCKHCDHTFLIPKYLALKCPTCTNDGRVRTLHIGRRIRCKQCGAMLQALADDHPSISSGEWRRKALGVSSASERPQRQSASTALFELELARLRGELEARGAERASAIQQLAEAQHQSALLEDQVRAYQAELTTARSERAPAAPVEEKLRRELEEAREQIETLWVQVNLHEHEAERTALVREELQALRAENTALTAEVKQAREASAAELEDAQARCRELECELLTVRTQYDDSALDRVELDHLNEELRLAQTACEELENRIAELEQVATQSAHCSEPEPAESANTQALQAKLDQAEERLRTEQARLAAERRAWSDEAESLEHRFDDGCRALRAEIESLRAECDKAHAEVRTAAAERDQMSAERAAAEASHRLEMRRLQGEMAELASAVGHAKERELASLRRQEELAAELERMQSERAELGQHQQGQNENYERALLVLQQELKAAVTDLDVERARLIGAAETSRSELEGQLQDSFQKYEQAQALAARLAAELRAANEQIEGLRQDIGLVHEAGLAIGAPVSASENEELAK